jgi:hypothetical protein
MGMLALLVLGVSVASFVAAPSTEPVTPAVHRVPIPVQEPVEKKSGFYREDIDAGPWDRIQVKGYDIWDPGLGLALNNPYVDDPRTWEEGSLHTIKWYFGRSCVGRSARVEVEHSTRKGERLGRGMRILHFAAAGLLIASGVTGARDTDESNLARATGVVYLGAGTYVAQNALRNSPAPRDFVGLRLVKWNF